MYYNIPEGIYNIEQLKTAIALSNGSPDNWQTLVSQLENMTPQETFEAVSWLEGCKPVYSESGEILGCWYQTDTTYSTVADIESSLVANAINSNTASAATKVATLELPQNAAINTATQELEIAGGSTVVGGASAGSTVATVAGHVGTWLVGAAVGAKLGVWINNLLYEANPDFWDNQNWGAINPDLWKSTKVTNWLYDFSGYDDFTCLVDSDGQMYIDEQVLALAAQYLQSQHAFDATVQYCTDDDLDPDLFNYPEYASGIYNFYVNSTPEFHWGSNVGYVEAENNTEPVYIFISSNNAEGRMTYATSALSRASFDLKSFSGNILSSHTFTNSLGETIYGVGPFTSNWGDGILSGVNFSVVPQSIYAVSGFWDNDISILLFHGSIVREDDRPEGIYPYAPMPQGITTDMTADDIINLLKQQYPEIWNPTDPTQPGAIKNGVLQPDGTITDHVYVPIPVPDGGVEGQPEISPNPSIQPDPDNDTVTKTIIKTVQPTPNPTPSEGDTGSGTTPPTPSPTGSADALYKIYNPTNAQIQSFGAWLWSSNFVDQLLKVFNDPMQAIISLHKIYASPHIGGSSNIKVGYLDSGVSSNWVDEQYIDVDCGTVNVFELSANIIDYMCDIRIYLPFIGMLSLDTADVMRGVVGVKYRIDVITGTCVAFVTVTRDAGAGGVIYQYTGSMAEVYPLSSGSYMGIITGVLGIAAGIAGTVASGGAAAPALIGGAAGVSALHTKIEHSNGFSGNAGALACKKPYIIISRPQSAMSNGVGHNTGWPANYYVRISQCSGYIRAKSLHLTGIFGATDTELREIEDLLKSGVIV